MRRVLRWVIGIVAVLLLLVAAAILFRNPLLKTITCWNIKGNTGLETTMGGFNLDLGNSSLKITRLRIYNAAAFGGSIFVDIPEIFCEIDTRDTAQGKIRFKEVRFNLAEANIVQNTNGLTNLEALKKEMEKKAPASGRSHTNGFEFGGIDKLVVTLGKLNFTDLQDAANNAQVDFGIQGETVRDIIKTNADLENWATALVLRVALQQAISGARQQSKVRSLENLLKRLK
jgi:hypothetical protein